MKNILLSFTILLSFFPLHAQILFDRHFPDSSSSEATTLRTTPEGYVISGSQLLHLDKTGNVLLQIPIEHNRAHAVPSDSGFVLGRNIDSGQRIAARGSINRYDKHGSQIWETSITSGHWRNFVEDVLPLADGAFVYTGRHQAVTGSGAVIRKLDSAGNILWTSKWSAGSTVSSYGHQIFLKDSSFYVIGNANASYDGQGKNRDLFVSRLRDRDGRRQMTYLHQTDSTDDVADMLLLKNNGLLMLGNSNGDTASVGSRGRLISLTDTAGWLVVENWVKIYPSQQVEQFRAIEMAPDSGYLILGNRGQKEIESVNSFLLRVDEKGEVVWEYVFPSQTHHRIGTDMEREDSSVYVIGGYNEDMGGAKDYFLTKVDLTHLLDSAFVGLEEESWENVLDLTLAPNPVADVLHISFQRIASKPIAVRILNLQGQEVDAFSPQTGNVFYSCEDLLPGIYLVEVRVGEQRTMKRLVIK